MPESTSNEPLTVGTLQRELRIAFATYHEVATRDLNDRFSHFEKRQEQQHQDMMSGLGEVISTVNDHMDERFDQMDLRFDRLEKTSVPESDGRSLPDRFDELAVRTGHPDLTSSAAQPAG